MKTFLYLNTGIDHQAKAVVSTMQFSKSNQSYSPITGGTLICEDNSWRGDAYNDEVFKNLSIGFTFNYDGSDFSNISIATNGFIAMGSSINTSSKPLSEGSTNNVISPLGGDLRSQKGSSIKTKLTGTAPNRMFTIQWDNYRHSGANANQDIFNFQIQLFETSNVIKFVYGSFTKNSADRYVQVGLRGASNSDFVNRSTSTNWASTTAGGSNASTCLLDNKKEKIPSEGLTFTFTPEVINTNSDLTLNIATDDINPCIGATIYYIINVANNGPDATTNVVITSAIPSGLTYQSATASFGSYNSGTGLWSINSLENEASATLTITAKVKSNQSGASITSSAALTSLRGTDANTANNNSSITIKVGTNNMPTISAIDEQSTSFNVPTGNIPFSIGDGAETPASSLVVTATSSNTYCVPLSNIILGGSGANRTIKIVPGNNQSGTSKISVFVSDGTCTAIQTFDVIVFRQAFSTWQSAKIVVGQTNFTSHSTAVSDIIAVGANNTAVSSKGVLAVGSQSARRVMLWKKVPTSNGTKADFVVGKANFSSTTSECSQSRTGNIDGVAFSPDGDKLIVSDAGNNRVLIFNTIPTSNGALASVVIGQTNFTNNGTGKQANQLNRPTEVLVTPDGKLLITDRNNHRILIFNRIPTSNGASADVVIGQIDLDDNSSGKGANKLTSPWNCSLSPDGKLLVADDGNNRVLVFNEVPTSNDADADVVIGQSDFTSVNSGFSKSQFNSPGVTVSPSGMVAIADYGNHRVLIFNSVPTTNGADADVVLGQPNFTSNVTFNNGSNREGSPSDKNMSSPYGINFDLNDRLYVNGRGMDRVMIFGETPTEVSNLSLSFSGSNSTPCVGGEVTYTVHVTNNGPKEATNVVVTSALPYGFTPLSFTPSVGTYNSNSGFWVIPSLPNGTTTSLTFTGIINAGQENATITAYASVRANNQSDNDFSNNAGSATIAVSSNSTPTISTILDQTIDIDAQTGAIEFTIQDTQTPVNSLVISKNSSNTSLIPVNNIVLGGSGATKTVKVTPASGQSGSATITLTIADGTCSSSKSFKINVGNVWFGYTTDWDTKSNWSSAIPDQNITTSIPSSPIGGNYPVINSAAATKHLIIENNASLTVNPTRTLTIYGNYSNSGSSFTGNGEIIFAGTVAQTIEGYIGNFTLNNTKGLSLIADATANGAVVLSAGSLNIGDNLLTIHKAVEGIPSKLETMSQSSIAIGGSRSGVTLPSHISSLKNFILNNVNGATLTSDLTVTGTLTLAEGALNINGKTLVLKGNAASTNGSILGNTSSDLSIEGSGDLGNLKFSGSQMINNLSLNRSSGGIISLGSNLIIANTLSLQKGRLKTGPYFIEVANKSENAIRNYKSCTDTESSIDNYIVGNLRRRVNPTGTYDLPVGCSSNYQLATVVLNSSTGIDYLKATFTAGETDLPNLVMGNVAIQDVIDNGFWTITPNDENNYTVDYNLTITSRGHVNGASTAGQHTLIKRRDSSSPWELLGVHNSEWNSGTGQNPITVTRKHFTSFSDESIGKADISLPVQLGDFTGKFENNTVKLTWSTFEEINNDHFEIERSENGIDFEKIGEVQGKGNSSVKSVYEFIDKNPWQSKYYYRLKQIDFNGEDDFFNIILVENKTAENSLTLSIYPNPTSSDNINLNIFSPNKDTDVKVMLIDIQGKILFSKVVKGNEIGNMQKLGINIPLSPRTYLIKIQQGNVSAIEELIINR